MWHLPIHIYGTTKQLTESGNYSNAGLSVITFTFTFSHLADAFIQSDLQLGST